MIAEESARKSKRLMATLTQTQKRDTLERVTPKNLLQRFSDYQNDEVICFGARTPLVAELTCSPLVTNKKAELELAQKLDDSVTVTKELPPKKLCNSYKLEPNTTQNEEYVTPRKQKKLNDDENVHVPVTPVVLLEKLTLCDSEEGMNIEQLFEEEDVYQKTRRALHSTCPTSLPGREKELGDLQCFILKHLNDNTSGTLYISGPPGTGKTASLSLILQNQKVMTKVKDVYVNCTSLKSSTAIFSRIVKDLGIKLSGRSEKDHIEAIEMHLKKCFKTILLILDEIDQLESKKQSILYTIFEWPSLPSARLILIGIANSLDLTDRILPRLQARCELKPKLMHFASYTKQQIIEILSSRLNAAGVSDIFSPAAIHMLAGKTAAISGDVRRALDIGRRIVELVASNKEDKVLKSVENLSQKQTKQFEGVSLKEVLSVINKVYGTTCNFDVEADSSLPLQQKILICSIVLILKKAKNKDVTLGRLHEVYRRVCQKRNIQVIDETECVGLCSLIETKGIIKMIKKKDPRMARISLVWNEEEVATALRDKQLLSAILQDEGCLGRL